MLIVLERLLQNWTNYEQDKPDENTLFLVGLRLFVAS